MVDKNLSESAVEINTIFQNMSIDVLNKIPSDFRCFFEKIASKDYIFEYDYSKKLNEQNLKPKTKGILALIYRDYLCTDYEREEYNKKYVKTLMIINQEKQKRYNSNNIFDKNEITNNISNIDNLPIKRKKFLYVIWEKIILKLKKIFKI